MRRPDGDLEWSGADPPGAHAPAPSTTVRTHKPHTATAKVTPLEAAMRKRILNDRLRRLGVGRKPSLPPNATEWELRLAGFFQHLRDW